MNSWVWRTMQVVGLNCLGVGPLVSLIWTRTTPMVRGFMAKTVIMRLSVSVSGPLPPLVALRLSWMSRFLLPLAIAKSAGGIVKLNEPRAARRRLSRVMLLSTVTDRLDVTVRAPTFIVTLASKVVGVLQPGQVT